MIGGTLAFVIGVVWLQWQPQLPPGQLLWGIPPLLLLGWRLASLRLPAALLLGFLWALLHAQLALDQRLVPELEGRDLLLEGVVSSLPGKRGGRLRFQFIPDRPPQDQPRAFPRELLLGWYGESPPLQAGERWRLQVRLKRPHGSLNPGGFDYERWLFSRGIGATGYVRSSDLNRRLAGPAGIWRLQQWREGIRERIATSQAERRGAAILTALAIGDRSAIQGADWALFRQTGTNHLVAISGLHIAIIAGLMLWVGRRLWCLSSRLCLLLPAPQAALWLALAAALIYTSLSGFAVPAQRALVMLLFAMGGRLWGNPVQPFRSLAAALLAVLLLDPFAVLSPGFWLSFMAVSVILLGFFGRPIEPGKGAVSLFRVQWLVSLGLFPLLLFWGLDVSLLAPLVNLLLVPLFSLLLVPLALFSVTASLLLSDLADPLLRLTAWLLSLVLQLLEHAASLPVETLTPSRLPATVWLATASGLLLLLLPRALPGRSTGALLLLPLFMARAPIPVPGELWLTILDVGQGLAVVVQTREHLLLYDSGPAYPGGADSGERILLPYLRFNRLYRIDRLILSNGDMDHAGGFASLSAALPITDVLSGEPGRFPGDRVGVCESGMDWRWDGVEFRILHPEMAGRWQGNNASCVLSIKTGKSRILLTGDMESRAEASLLTRLPQQLQADLVVVPHHGSSSSSTADFVDAVSPEYAVVSSGYRNRYGFPKAAVVSRWRRAGARLYNTATSGAIHFRIDPEKGIASPEQRRVVARRYWMR